MGRTQFKKELGASLGPGKGIAMLHNYYSKPQTIDRVRAHWLGEAIARYVTWMHDQGYEFFSGGVGVSNGRLASTRSQARAPRK
jgi:hypothetical protein